MAIPKFTEFMLPLLEWLQDGQTKYYKDFTPFIVEKMKISDEDQNVLLSSGYPLFENRYGWAKLYLIRSGLLETPQRGMIKITEDGLRLYKSGPSKLSTKDLEKYPNY